MKQLLITFTFLLSLLASELTASHIVAGFSSYRHLSGNTYEIEFNLIRDIFSGGSQLDPNIDIQVYTFNDNTYEFYDSFVTPIDDLTPIEYNEDLSPNVFLHELEQGKYIFEYDLATPDDDYYFVYQRCCRSQLFTNILEPEAVGISLSAVITKEAQAVQNSSIQLEEFPNFINFIGIESDIEINAISLDGDDLSFELAPSYVGGGLDGSTGPNSGDPNSCTGVSPQGPCPPPYEQVEFAFANGSFSNPFPNWDNQGMNANNGKLLGTPNMQGQFAYGFAIHETRDGQIINTTQFDFLTFVLLPVNNEDYYLGNQLELHKNPSNGSFYLINDLDLDLNYEVYNLRGEKMQSTFKRSNDLIEIDFDGPAGMYILKAFNGSYHQNLKLLKL